jgi:type II secretory pathway pseudopilin PulG
LIELMIGMVIIGILLGIGLPKLSLIINKSKEATTKGNLGVIRSAISIYYAEVDGFYPSDDLSTTLLGPRLPEIPEGIYPTMPGNLGHGGPSNLVRTGVIPGGGDDMASRQAWLYDNTGPGSATWGQVIANCSHNDFYGAPWSAY